MKHVSNEQMAKKIAEESKQYFYHDEYECGLACAKRMAKLKDKQHEQEKQQLIDRAADFISQKFYIGINNQATSKENYYSLTELIRDFTNSIKGE